MKKICKIFFLFFTLNATAQETLSLQDCYTLVAKNYPLAKQTILLDQQTKLENDIVRTGKLPKLDFLAQSSYQSDVTFFPVNIPNSSVQPTNKDQYKTTLSVNQLIYNGGIIKASSELKKKEFKTKQQQVSVKLYQLKSRINQLYFSILLLQEQKQLIKAKTTQLHAKLKEINAGIEYGSVMPASNQVLEAELLKINQQIVAIDSDRNLFIESLSAIIGKNIDKTSDLDNPTININFNTSIDRPESALFQLQKEQINASKTVITKKNRPKIVGFAIGGYGNPGLNVLDNSFQTFYMVGFKLNWNIFDWNNVKMQHQSLEINNKIIENQQDVFNLNTNIQLQEQQAEIEKINAFIKTDKQIIELREKVLQSASSQLKNGVITPSAYLTEFTNLFEAKNNLNLHTIQLLLAKATYNTTQGQ
jgi:outer membrane protein TolC